jgi:hypothetical protein
MSGIRSIFPLALLGALYFFGDDVADREPMAPIDLPRDLAHEVYSSDRTGRAIAYVREGRLFVVARDEGIVFALEPARDDMPPLVMAVARELAPEVTEPGASATVVLTDLKLASTR